MVPKFAMPLCKVQKHKKYLYVTYAFLFQRPSNFILPIYSDKSKRVFLFFPNSTCMWLEQIQLWCSLCVIRFVKSRLQLCFSKRTNPLHPMCALCTAKCRSTIFKSNTRSKILELALMKIPLGFFAYSVT